MNLSNVALQGGGCSCFAIHSTAGVLGRLNCMFSRYHVSGHAAHDTGHVSCKAGVMEGTGSHHSMHWVV